MHLVSTPKNQIINLKLVFGRELCPVDCNPSLFQLIATPLSFPVDCNPSLFQLIGTPLSFPVDCNPSLFQLIATDKIEKYIFFYLQEKDLIHKLFKVLLPRYQRTSTYTQMYMLPPDVPGYGKDMAVLELKGQFEMERVNTVVRAIA